MILFLLHFSVEICSFHLPSFESFLHLCTANLARIRQRSISFLLLVTVTKFVSAFVDRDSLNDAKLVIRLLYLKDINFNCESCYTSAKKSGRHSWAYAGL